MGNETILWRQIEVLRQEKWVKTDGWDIIKGEKWRILGELNLKNKIFIALDKPKPVEPKGNWMISVDIEEL